tara:strand:- start:73 stop:1275 length:1203 start_codon:yes stop_codon:yes gene_type:complete
MNNLLENLMFTNNDNRYLSTYACLSSESRGRIYKDDTLILGRSEFQRDRDRVIHSEAFRRLKDKTQVFVFHEGDHYRTRLSHTLEVSQIARSIAKALNINEDLTETIALAHDLGHPPLGHKGEDILQKLMEDAGGFNHNEQSLRVITILEKKYPNFDGLNLTYETLEGLIKHNGPFLDIKKIPQTIKDICNLLDIDFKTHSSLEGQVANISDDIAYLTHDFDDGLREKLFTLNDLRKINIINHILKNIEGNFVNIKNDILIHQLIRHLISYFINDIVSNSLAIIKENKFSNVNEIRNFGKKTVKLSVDASYSMEEIRNFLFKKMYSNETVVNKLNQNVLMIEKLFLLFIEDINKLPQQWKYFNGQILSKLSQTEKLRVITDYIAGMTDNYLKREYDKFYK